MSENTDSVPNLYYYTAVEGEDFLLKVHYELTVTRLAPNCYILIPHRVKNSVDRYLRTFKASNGNRRFLMSVPESDIIAGPPVPQYELNNVQPPSGRKFWFNLELWLLRSKPTFMLLNDSRSRSLSRSRSRSPSPGS
eukprot:Lankesteria_metandrocarpae@DN690_c0_g1_i1.p1